MCIRDRHKAAVEAASKRCLELGARRVIPLQVSGAFHSSLLLDAAKELRKVLAQYNIKQPSIPVDVYKRQILHTAEFFHRYIVFGIRLYVFT